MKPLTIELLHHRLLEIAAEFHKLCVDNNIPYYMLGGSMLGAVRHNGFIPWDDDMDFGVPREFFEKFIALASKHLPPQYSVLTYKNSESMILGFAKISDNNTVIVEQFSTKKERKLGVNVDVFPLDHSSNKKGVFTRNYLIRSLIKLQKIVHVDASNRSLPKKLFAIFVQFLLPINKMIIIDYIERNLLKRCYMPNAYSSFSNYYGAWGLRETIRKDIFGKPTLYKFCDLELFGPSEYDEYLSELYGDYMKLPPEEKQHLHQEGAFEL